MTLHVPFEQFAKTVSHLLDAKDVFVTAHGSGALATASDPAKQILIVSKTEQPVTQTKSALKRGGLETFDGAWKLSDEVPSGEDGRADAFVAAVAYKSAESMPGLWMDAYEAQPTQVQVLRAMYEEFRHTGELPDVSFEEFVRLSEPNVIIVSPNEIQSFLDKKGDC